LHARRYVCRSCAAVITVVPRQVLARRHFGAGAIGFALFVYGKLRAAAGHVAKRVGLWGRGPGAWRTVRRWLAAVEDGRLFRGVRASPGGWSPRRRAERAAMTLAARSLLPETAPEEARVFEGAAVAT
jgi:hypothetical protein